MTGLMIAATLVSGVALESGICPARTPITYAVQGGTPADRATIATALGIWASATAPGPAEIAEAARQSRLPRVRSRRMAASAIAGLRFVETGGPAHWTFRVGDAGAGIRTEGSCGFLGHVFYLPSAPAPVTVLHEIGHGLGLQHPSRIRAYDPPTQEAIVALFAASYGYSREATIAQTLAPFGEPIRTSPDGPSLMEILPPAFGLPSPDGMPTAGDLAFVRQLYPPFVEIYRIPPPRRRP